MSMVGKFFLLPRLAVVIIVAIIVIAIFTVVDIHPIEDHAKDFCIHLKKNVLCPLEGHSWSLAAQNDQNDPIDHGGEDDRVGKSNDGRTVDDDVIKPFTQSLHHIAEKIRSDKLRRIRGNRACRNVIQVLDIGLSDH